jgi:L-amino acid N-acyltransferase YncA
MELKVRRATGNDAAQFAEIYNEYVARTNVTFETDVVPIEEMRRRVEERLEKYEWLVGEIGQRIVGYAYYGPFRPRAAYFRTVESTIYMAQDCQGQGLGRRLYTALMESAHQKGFREVIGVIALPNPASIALHAGLGFREAGLLRGVGLKFGGYHDVALWQRSLQPTINPQ